MPTIDKTRLGEAVFVALCEWFEDPNGDGLLEGAPGVDDWNRRMQAALLAALPKLLGQFRPAMQCIDSDRVVFVDQHDPVPTHGLKNVWVSEHAPTLGDDR